MLVPRKRSLCTARAASTRADLLAGLAQPVGGQLLVIDAGDFDADIEAIHQRAGDPPLAVALGPFMLFRREAYRRIGGHQAVGGEIAEDVVLARQVARAGGRGGC